MAHVTRSNTGERGSTPSGHSNEPSDRITQERVKEHFKPKPKPEPEKVINPVDLKGYERTIIKTTEKKKRQSKSSSFDVPQLGAQKK